MNGPEIISMGQEVGRYYTGTTTVQEGHVIVWTPRGWWERLYTWPSMGRRSYRWKFHREVGK